jgi:hypothetical protein
MTGPRRGRRWQAAPVLPGSEVTALASSVKQMRLGQARSAQLRKALQISCGKTLTAAWLSMRQRLPHRSPVHPVPAGQRPRLPGITPDALEQLSLRGRHQTLLTPRSTTKLPRATRPAGPLQADMRIPSPGPQPGRGQTKPPERGQIKPS